MNERRLAHFLLTHHLRESPPNDSLRLVMDGLDYKIDFFSPGTEGEKTEAVEYGFRWIVKNLFRPSWGKYSAFSCTSEDPIVVAGLLALVWRKPLIFLADEIRAGSYRGEKPERWKRLCRWFMRRANLTIVNDQLRIRLQRDYAQLKPESKLVVYPGCFVSPPAPSNRERVRQGWGIDKGSSVLAFSGIGDLMAGMDLALNSLDRFENLNFVSQPLGMTDLTRFLVSNHRHADRIFIEGSRLGWRDAWSQAAAADIGVAMYKSSAPQFQLMGISSNRLCMFLAMGVPVIVSKQASFDFLDEWQCGRQVETQQEFNAAVESILADLAAYKHNALRCAKEYIDTDGKFSELTLAVEEIVSKRNRNNIV